MKERKQGKKLPSRTRGAFTRSVPIRSPVSMSFGSRSRSLMFLTSVRAPRAIAQELDRLPPWASSDVMRNVLARAATTVEPEAQTEEAGPDEARDRQSRAAGLRQ